MLDKISNTIEPRESKDMFNDQQTQAKKQQQMIYKTEDIPPLFSCILYSIQQAVVGLSGIIFSPIVLANKLCAPPLVKAEFIGCGLVIAGIASLIQITFGTRLSLIQGPSASYLLPILVIAEMNGWTCEETLQGSPNFTSESVINQTVLSDPAWMLRMRELQGSMMLASIVEIVVGLTGFSGFLLRFVGPLTICPTLLMIGLGYRNVCRELFTKHWGLSILTLIYTIGFSFYMPKIPVPIPTYKKKEGCFIKKIYPFQTIAIFLAIIAGYLTSVLMTVGGAFPDDPSEQGYFGRYDANTAVLYSTSWFRFPYPGQWGTPTINTGMVLAFIMVSFCSMIESLGDYYATAHISSAPPLPAHAVNRGIAMEGLGCLITGAIGGSVSVTTHSSHIGMIGITKVASRRVFQMASVVIIICGLLNKLGGVFTTIPAPVIGAVLTLGMALVGSIGVSTLSAMDMSSTRNLAILGMSLMMGLIVPDWMMMNPNRINTGYTTLDQIIRTLLGTSIFVSGVLACFLDNTVPGTLEERGLRVMKSQETKEKHQYDSDISIYDLPYITEKCKQYTWTRYIPFLPNFTGENIKCLPSCLRKKSKRKDHNDTYDSISQTVI